jgi:hypothetical protein
MGVSPTGSPGDLARQKHCHRTNQTFIQMKKQLILAGSLAVATGVTLLVPSARAAANVYTEGDLLLGFEKPGSSNNYVVDIGSFDHYIGISGTINITTTLGLGNIAADLANSTTGFGANWFVNSNSPGSNVQWGIIGGSNNSGPLTIGTQTVPKNTLFETFAEDTYGIQSDPLQRHNNTGQNAVNGNIATVGLNFNGSAQTGNSTRAEFQTSTDATSWGAQNPSFAAFGNSFGIEQPASGPYIGPTNSQLDLYELTVGSGNGTYLGSFTLDSSGNLFYSSSPLAVPEPASWSFVGVGAALLGMRRRRRSFVVA